MKTSALCALNIT